MFDPFLNVYNPYTDEEIEHYGVYGIIDKTAHEPIYVGMTYNSFGNRWSHHDMNLLFEYKNQQRLYEGLRQLLREGHRLEYRIFVDAASDKDNHLTKNQIECMEYALIKTFQPKLNTIGTLVPYLLNK